MTSLRRWDLNRAPPPLRGQGPQPVSTDPDWASTRPARPSISPSSAPLSRGLCPEAPLCSPPVRDHTPWISLRCAPAWSPRWHAETCCNPTGTSTVSQAGDRSAGERVGVRSLFLCLSPLYLCCAEWKNGMWCQWPQIKGTRRGSPFHPPQKGRLNASFLLFPHSDGEKKRVSFLSATHGLQRSR